MKLITWDVGILAALGILLAYSLLIRKHKALATLVSVYVAYVMTSIWGDRIAQFFTGDRVIFHQVWINANTSVLTVQVVFLAVVTLLLSSFIKLGGKRARYSMVEVGVYSVCTLALGVVFVLAFMTPEARAHVLHVSKIAPFLYMWREWVLVIPVFAMVFFGIYGDED